MKNSFTKVLSGLALAVAVLATSQPFVLSALIPQANATGAALNVHPQDFPVLEVSNYSTCTNSSSCWSSSISGVRAGQTIAFVMYAHNTGSAGATNTRVSMQLSQNGSQGRGYATISADNASPVSGYAYFTLDPSVQTPISLTYVGGEYYRQSSLDPYGPDALPNGQTPRGVTQGGVNVGTLPADAYGSWNNDMQLVARFRVDAAQACTGTPSLTVSPSSQTTTVGNSVQYTATYDSNGSNCPGGQTDVTGSASWSADNSGIASSQGGGSFRGNAQGSTTVRATYQGASDTASVTVTGGACTGSPSLTVSPSSQTVGHGGTVQYTATYDSNGSNCPGGEVNVTSQASWSSCAVADHLGGGGYRGRTPGSCTITAYYSGTSDSASLTVNSGPVLNPTLVIVPPTQTINVAESASYRALYDADGPGGSQGEVDVTGSSSWSSANSGIGSSQGGGSFRGNAQGSTTVRANYGGLQASATLNVNSVVCTGNPTFEVTPSSQTTTVGNSVQYTATYDSNGSCSGGQTDVTSYANWSSTSVADSLGGGRYRGRTAGTGTVSASYQGLGDSATIIVRDGGPVGNPTLVIVPPTQTINVNSTATYRALYDADGPSGPQGEVDVTTQSVWSSDSGIASSQGGGSFRGNSQGSTTVRANYGGLQATASLTVLSDGGCTSGATLRVSPTRDTVDVGDEAQYRATYDSNGSCSGGESDVTDSAEWTVDSTSIAANLGRGEFRGRRDGSTTVRARYSGLTDTATLRVNDDSNDDDDDDSCNGSATLVIVPFNATTGVGQSFQYRALYDQDGPGCSDNGDRDVTGSSNWSTSNPGVASSAGNGSVRGNAAGNTPVFASYRGITANANMTVIGTGGPVIQQPPVIIQQPPVVIGGGTTIVSQPQPAISTGVAPEGVACLTVTPSVDVDTMLPNQEFVYTTLYRNDCPFALNNAVLRVYMPAEVDILASSNPFFIREGQKMSYNLGILPPGGQGSVAITGYVHKDSRLGDTLMFTSSIEFLDGTNRIQSASSYLAAILGGAITRPLTASLTDTLGAIFGSGWFWLLVILIVLAGIIWLVWTLVTRRRTEQKVVVAAPRAADEDPLRALRNA